MPSFEVFQVSLEQPTSLAGRTSVPLPASDTSFYPAVNSYLVPCPLDANRLCLSLAKTLQLFPLHCGVLSKNHANKALSIKLIDQPVRLTVGTSEHPGPFARGWQGEKHPDYYEELDRGDLSSTEGAPLCQAKVTTWKSTGQTAIFVSQSYALGDAFAILHFMKTWSAFYQGKEPPFRPSFEKYFLPVPQIEPRSSLASDLAPLSFMAADFDETFFEKREELIQEQTVRLDIDFPGDFVNQVWTAVKEERHLNNPKVSRGDAFSGYLIAALQASFEEPVETLHQLVAMRGRTVPYNKEDFTFPLTTQGNAYMIWSTPITTPRDEQTPGSHAQTLFRGRKILADNDRIGRSYMLYNSFYEKAIARDRVFIDSGYTDAIAINWLVNVGLNDPDFGFPLQSAHIEWESLEKFVQVWRANPIQQGDGTWRRDPSGLHILLRLRPEHASRFLDKLQTDMNRLAFPQAYASSPAALLQRLRGPSPQTHDAGISGQVKARL